MKHAESYSYVLTPLEYRFVATIPDRVRQVPTVYAYVSHWLLHFFNLSVRVHTVRYVLNKINIVVH